MSCGGKGLLLVILQTGDSSCSTFCSKLTQVNLLLSSPESHTPSSSDSWSHRDSLWAQQQNPVTFAETHNTNEWSLINHVLCVEYGSARRLRMGGLSSRLYAPETVC